MSRRVSADLLEERIRRGRERQHREAPEERIERRRDDGPAPLSFAQQRLWFLQQLDPASAAFNIARAFELRGDLDRRALDRALHRVASRHAVLRTLFHAVEGHGRQVVLGRTDPPLDHVDLSAAAEPRSEVERLRRADLVHPFDLEAAPPWRARLFDLGSDDGERRHVLLFNFHHILFDGWSMGVFLDELGALYAEEARGVPARLAELPVQYADYAAWQRRRLDDARLEPLVEWWRRHLAGAPDVVELAADHPRPPFPSYRGAKAVRPLRAGLTAAVRGHGERGITPFMVGLAGFAALLARFTGSHDLVIGSPIAGRTRSEVEGLVGFFVNTLALRVDLGGDPGFDELLRRVRESTLGAYAHQEAPFEVLVERLSPQRRLSHTPLFQAVFTLRSETSRGLRLAGVEVEPLPRQRVPAQFDLNLSLVDRGDRLDAELIYSLDLFRGDTAERMLSSFETLLAGALAEPRRRLSELPVLDDEGWRRMVVELNRTARPYERHGTVHGLFRRRAAERPEEPALAWLTGDGEADGGEPALREMTYGTLDAAADRLARRLVAAGVAPGDAVGVSVERSPALVAALLAVFKAGAFYVPLDPEYPRERFAFMLDDSRVRVLVETSGSAPSLPAGDLPRIVLGEGWDVGDGGDGDTTAVDRSPGSGALAYVMYTSGSTGRPKGVAVSHRAVLRLVRNNDFANLGPDETWLHFSSASFDASTLELWAPLLNGGRLALAPPGKLSLAELGRAVRRLGVTSAWLTAGLFQQMVEARLDDLGGLRQVLAGGDVLSPAHVERVLRELPGTRLINGYGPTENTTFTACHTASLDDRRGPVPLGRPVANSTVYVVDRNLRPQPMGVPGELCAGGDGVAVGYLGRPALTAERFVPDPFGAGASATDGAGGGRLYRTGDLARWLPDGTLDFLGRFDDQVKLRGFRVEPGEVEALLSHAPGVAAGAVVVRADGGAGADRQLVAYAVADQGWEPSAAALRDWLGERLPEHMLPAHFVFLDALPLNPNGKLDRRALPAPEVGLLQRETEYVAPRTPIEEQVVEIWLGLIPAAGRVGVHDDFFHLGGHSLLATRVVSRLRQVFGVDLPLRLLFEATTPATLAARIETALGTAPAPAPPIRRAERHAPLPLSLAQERLWFLDRFEPGATTYNLPFGWDLEGALDLAALAAAVGDLVRRHEALRTRFVERGEVVPGDDSETPVQVVDPPPAALTLPRVDLSALPPARSRQELERASAALARRPFDLAADPMLRAVLIRRVAGSHRFVAVLHHIVADGWSLGVAETELSASYAARRSGAAPELPVLPVQYADYAAWQRRRLADEALEEQVAWWTERLAGVPVLELPTDRPRPALRRGRGAVIRFRLPPQLSAAVLRVGRELAATPFMVLLAAFQALLGRYAGRERFAVGTPVAGRGRREIESLIGFFVNTLALPADLGGAPGFAALVARVRETTLAAYGHQEVPFERLVNALTPQRRTSHTPVYQVMFSLQNTPGESLTLPGVEVRRAGLDAGAARCDLTLLLREEGGPGGPQLAGLLEYDRDLFDATTVRRLVGHLQRLLTVAAEEPGVRVTHLPLLTAAEAAQVTAGFNATAVPFPRGGTIHALVARRAAETPDAPALLFKDGDGTVVHTTYRDLVAGAHLLARRLVAAGVRPGEGVGLAADRSPRLPVAILGILAAGAHYVPLDPNYPAERLAGMLADAGCRLVVEDRATAGGVLDGLEVERLELAAALAGPAVAPRAALPVVDGGFPAYVMFTSGSTGRPKGVMVRHASVLRLVQGGDFADLSAQRTWMLIAATAFDASTLELWAPLTNGGRLAVPAAGRLSLDDVERTIADFGVDVAFITVGLFNQLVEEKPASLVPLGHVMTGGDVVSPGHVARAMEAGPRVSNVYGPTENTTYSTHFPVTPADTAAALPIGRPIANTTCYVLDAHVRPLPVGVPGELWVGGAGVAMGYVGRPAQTAERFVPDPFGGGGQGAGGARLYRTGDLARWRPDGRLEFVGRVDDQVKIRGFRIEPGEVEVTLKGLPGVVSAVVNVHRGGGDKRLVAYAVVAEGTSAADLRRGLEERLPGYMVPAAFVLLDELPLDPNGKVDRRALPAPPADRDVSGREFVAPRNRREEELAALWADLLGLDRVGVEDDFFELGGHSLLATRLAVRVRRRYGVEVPLVEIFEHPTVAGLAAWLAAARGGGAVPDAPVPLGRDEPLPASYGQERLWFLEQMEPGTALYLIPGALRLRGPLDAAALGRSLGRVVERHEALRTRLLEVDGRPVQEVAPALAPAHFPLPMVDLAALPAARRETAARAVLGAEHHHPFDLAGGLLARALLVRLAPQHHLLSWVLHHVASDGWSAGLLMREMCVFYRCETGVDDAPRLPELPIQYPDFAVWQRRRLESPEMTRQVEHWRHVLAGAPEALDLPTDRPRPRLQTFRAGTWRQRLDGGLSRRVGEAASAAGATPFMVLLAALAVVLSRQAGQTDVLVGAPSAGRDHPDVEHLIGFFLNTLVLRLDLSGRPGFAALVEQARDVATRAYAHQEVPFERLLNELEPERDLSRTPFFQVLLNLVPPVSELARLPGIECERVELPSPHSKFDLTLYADTAPGGDGYRLGWVYNRDLFDPERVEELARQVEAVLEGGLARPERPVDTLSLLTPAAAESLAAADRVLPAVWEDAVHELVARRAAAHPERPAVADGETAWSYGELKTRARAVAAWLRRTGVGRGHVVAVHGARRAALAPALLGVMESGAAFTVLDPAHPPSRRARMLRTAAARALVVVAGEVEMEVLESLDGAPQVQLSQLFADVSGMLSDDFAKIEVGPEDVAYVAFTSGSTGEPKGIVGSHGALARYLPSMAAALGVGEDERVSLLAGLSHDPLHRDLFVPLQLGGFLAVPDPERLGEPGYLARWMGEQGITHAHLTPAMCQLVTEPVERGERELLPRLRRVIFYGEKVRHRDVERLRALAPHAVAWVSYGATETSRAASYHRVEPAELASARTLALGRGGPDSELLVLDRNHRRAGVGELGEVWMRGPNLARGYLRDTRGTADRWRPLATSGEPGERVYRTGDLGRYRPDGEVVYAGRADDQVKIRGFRVEPAEVERVLGELPEVARVAVVARSDDARGTYLAAYVVPAAGAIPAPAALRARCAERLPEYMVPLAFATLEALPLTANNKLDRRALPAPEPLVTEAEHELPRSPLEEMVVELWRELLQVQRVGIHDSFFELGGHSLLATRATSRLRRAAGVEVPLRELFEHPTAAALASRVEERLRRAGGVELPRVEPRAEPGPGDLPLSFSQQRQWFLEQIDPGSPAYRIPTALAVGGPLEPAVVARAVAALVSRHETLRTTFPRVDGEPVQRVAAAGSPLARESARLALVDLTALPAERRDDEALRQRRAEAARPMDLAAGALARWRLFRLAADAHQLFFVIHHIVTDGWSGGVIIRELAALVEAFTAGAPSPLPPLRLQYGDFALWQRGWMAGDVLDAQLAWWRDRLTAVPPLELPTDRPRPAVQTHRGERAVHPLGRDLTAGVRHLAQRRGATLFMVVLAAWEAVLGRLAGQREFAVGTFIANRNRAELEPLVGFFVNSLALTADLSGDPSFDELLDRVRGVTLGAYAHQDVPFEKLLEELTPQRDLSRSPLFQVMIVGLDVGRGREDGAGRRWRPLPRESDRAAVDMTLWIYESGDDARLELEYNRDLFDAATAEATVGRVARVLEAVGGDGSLVLADLPLLSDGERRRLLVERNATAWDHPRLTAPVHEQVAERARRDPEAPAVETTAGPALSYGELAAAADRLARHLAARGVGADVPVGVCLERGPELVVALLAVLEAGGAYLPLDPAYPADRLAFQVTDSGTPVVLTGDATPEGLETAGAELLPVDVLLAGAPPDVPLPAAPPGSAAYVIYTSGSSGRPKGVVVPHGALSAFVAGSARVTGVGADDRVLQFLSISFDASVEEVWPTLVRGGALVLRDDAMLASPGELLRRCGALGITFLDLPTAFWHQVAAALRDGEAELPASLRLTIAGGEAVLPDGLDAWRRGAGEARFLNTYGPTEATCVATWWETPVPEGRGSGDGGPVPIGRPMPNVTVYLLDRRLRPVPEGAAGELVLGGAGVARGYLGRPAATAEVFVPDPFSEAPGARLYRTGDLARWRGDGELAFLGRTDDQVKVRGFRVELGDVEAALARHPRVREAAAVLRRDGAASSLVGYVATAGGALPDDLRDHLRATLPDYMVPSPLVALAELPKTPGGKVDRAALPDPDPAAAAAGYVEPATLAEELLAEIWEEVLGLDRVGAGDDFFALGGHSLLATQVVNRLAREIDLEMPVRQLFATPVLRDIAAEVEARLLVDADGDRDDNGGGETGEEAAGTGPAPLSSAQERLWFLHRFDPGSAAYNVAVTVELDGELDPAALRTALAAVVERQDTLRTAVVEEPGEDGIERPVQVARPVPPPPLPLLDLTPLPAAAAPPAELPRWVRLPFDLAAPPLVRALLLRRAPRRHRLLLCVHHLAADGWSLDLLVHELETLYRAAADGRPAHLPPLPLRYADYAARERRRLAAGEMDADLKHWRRQLDGAPRLLDLPTDRPRPAVRDPRGRHGTHWLSAGLREAVEELAERRAATPFMVHLAAFAALLGRLAGVDEVVVGTPFSNRGRMELESLVGMFVNTLPLRLDLAAGGDATGDTGDGPTFATLVDRVRERVLAAMARADVPFERLVDELVPERNLSHTPLFQVLFAHHRHAAGPAAPAGGHTGGGLRWRPHPVDTGVARFDLAIDLFPVADGRLAARWETSAALFDPSTADRLHRHLTRLLEAAVEDPGRPLGALPLLRSGERHQIVAGWNDTARRYDAPELLHVLVERQVDATPDAPALRYRGEVLTYRQLEARVNRLARLLAGRGVGPEVRVAVAMERGVDLVVALHAVVKAGGAYVPVDPGYPAPRVRFLLSDALEDGGLVLTREALRGALEPSLPTGVELLAVDAPETELAALPTTRPATTVDPENPAYAIYTSGSTGRPKGTLNRHRSIVNRLLWMQETFPIGSGDRVLHKTPFSFDVSVWELFWPLLAGAELVVAEPGAHRDPAWLARTVREEGVTTMHFVPSMLGPFLSAPEAAACGAELRRVICSGEALPPDLVRRFHRELGGGGGDADGRPRLFNLYGPTEAAVDVTWTPCDDPAPRRVTLGRPVANTRMHVADRRFRPQPVGVAGELLIGGVQLARGYLGRPALTAERFVPDPFAAELGTEPGGRVYRTGDLGRYLPDGEIEYLGRLDHQAKIRGFRVEPGEVAAVLGAAPGVAEAAAVVREDRPGGSQLVAYAVPAEGATTDSGALRLHLAEQLPDDLVPAHVVLLDALPLTANGKLDRGALPAPDRTVEVAEYAPPESAAEELLAELWREVLDVERVGRRDHFFRLGGHSLLATALVARLRRAADLELPVRAVFEQPTLEELARVLEERLTAAAAGAEAAPSRTPTLAPRPGGGPAPLSFAQERLWFLDRLQPDAAVYNIPVVLTLDGELDRRRLDLALTRLAQRQGSLRTRLVGRQEDGGQRPVQVIDPTRPLTPPRVDLAALGTAAEDELLRLVRAEARRPFRLQGGPLTRFTLVRTAPRRHHLLLTLHHAVADGWSLAIVERELQALYHRGADLPPLPVQYADFAAWQRRVLQGDELERQLAYWRRRLEGAPSHLELPTDRPRRGLRRRPGGRLLVSWPPSLARAIEDLGWKLSASPFMVLLAAWTVLLGRLAEQREVVVGIPVANRTRWELEHLVGFFANTLAVRTAWADVPSFGRLVERVRDQSLEDFAHQDLPFERLVAELNPSRDLAYTPVFQTALVLQNTPRRDAVGDAETDGGDALAVRRLGAYVGSAKFDLTLNLSPVDGYQGSLEYDRGLFDRRTVERWLGHLETFLEAALRAPETPPAALPLLTAAERRRLVLDGAGGEAPLPAPALLHAAFAARAARRPDAPALRCGETRLSYADLRRRAAALAARLRRRGVGPETRVGVAMERSPELVVALLGVLQAGAAWLPVDPDYPPQRVEHMLAEGLGGGAAGGRGAAVLLTQPGLRDRLAPALPPGVELLALPPGAPGETADEPPLVPPGLAADSPAYVIYTSGTTGVPKGVVNRHRAILNRVRWMADTLEIGPGDRVLHKAPFSFDVSIWEIFCPLVSGAELVLAEPGGHREPAYLVRLIRESEITLAQFVPSLLATFLEQPGVEGCVCLRYLVASGEALPAELVRRFHHLLGVRRGPRGVRLLNLYGPTETAVGVAWKECADPEPGRVTLGGPIDNVRLHVVDRDMEPLPAGVAGELVVGGMPLARGYLGRPGLTAERFVPDPFRALFVEAGDGSELAGDGRLYRTGDLARRLPDGEIEFLGRLDQQVKLRGLRIELGEIEAALAAIEGVSGTAVVLRDDGAGPRLVAYLTFAEGAAVPSPVDITGKLGRRLPEHMLPSHFVFLDAFPLTPSGKLDRRALPAPDGVAEAAGYEAPVSAAEELLVELWQEVLDVERVGRCDHFFGLGGHSLLATMLVARLERRLGVALPVRSVFEHPRLEDLAVDLEERLLAAEGMETEPTDHEGDGT